MSSVSLIAHTDLPFANPMAEEAIDEAVAALPLCADPRVVDTGCGGGEILMRTMRAHPGARGVGVDLDPDAIAAARARAGDLPVRFEVRDAATLGGSFDAVLNVASSHVLGGFPGVLEAMHALAPVALYGEGFWQRPPAPAFLAALGEATEDELADLDGLRQTISDASFEILDEWFASDSDWQHYEETLAANAEHHGTPEALAYARRIRERRALPDCTDTPGFGLFVLRRHRVVRQRGPGSAQVRAPPPLRQETASFAIAVPAAGPGPSGSLTSPAFLVHEHLGVDDQRPCNARPGGLRTVTDDSAPRSASVFPPGRA